MIKNIIKNLIPQFILKKIQIFRNERNRQNPVLSFSQAGEDRILHMWINILKLKKMTYIDIGAYDPFLISNTALFYQQGYRGINIEPNPVSFQRFVKQRTQDININVGIAAKSGTLQYFMMDNDTLNTFLKMKRIYIKAKEFLKSKK